MPAQRIDGTAVAAALTEETAKELSALRGITPGIAVVLVGDDPASHLYVSLKEKACAKLGITFRKILLPATSSLAEIMKTVLSLNADDAVDAILVQLPLPAGIDEHAVIGAIDPRKDVDGFHPATIESMRSGSPTIVPGLAAGIMALIHRTGRNLEGLRMLVVANSETFAEPIMHLARNEGIFAAYTLPDAADVRNSMSASDIVVVAVGRADFLTGEMLKNNAIVIDVGTNRKDGAVVGDSARSVWTVASHVTPVPGGVGPVTVAMLIRNIVRLAKLRRGL